MEKIKYMIPAIERWAEKDPQRVCYHTAERDYTYQELSDYSNHLAAHLLKSVPGKAPIVVFGELEFEMLACFLACIKTGHAYIPMETSTPEERIQLIYEVAQPVMTLAVADLPIEVEPRITKKELQTFFTQTGPVKAPPESNWVKGDENYYIIFTSGTTGVPKGVQISHDNLVSFVTWMTTDFHFPAAPRFLAQAPYSFDLSVMDLYPALVLGGSLYPLTKEQIVDFKTLFEVLPQLPFQIWVSTPSFADICLMDPQFAPAMLPQLTQFLFCGEELTHDTAKNLLERFPEVKVFNTYGPTETTVAISGLEITPDILAKYPRLPIGYVKEDSQVEVVDEKLTPVKNGEIGELLISGPCVSKGYLNNPEKTAEAFVTLADGRRAYRTKDAARMMDDGLLLYEGRLDFQVKLHGYRIELEEVDHHLMESQWVKQACTVPKYSAKTHKVQQLVAYVVANKNSFEKPFQLTQAIKKELGESVMDYMIPTRFIYLPQLPRTANGKIDRKSLIKKTNGGQ